MTGLILNASKCEITAKNYKLIDKFSIFKDFKRVAAEDHTLLGAPILKEEQLTMLKRTRADDVSFIARQ